MNARRYVRAASACGFLLVSVSLPAIASAQLAGEIPPPARVVTDENGVNVATGQYRSPRTNMVVGSGLGTISDDRIYGRQTWNDARISLYNPNDPSGPLFVRTDSRTYVFNRSASGFAPTSEGAKLVVTSGIYQVILLDGTKYTYGQVEKASRHADSREYDYDAYAYLTTIDGADGFRTTLNWLTSSYCPYGPPPGGQGGNCRLSAQSASGPPPQIWKTRLTSISNSAGYRIEYQYAGDSLAGSPAPTQAAIVAWSTVTGARGANAQGGAGTLPSATYVYATSTLSTGGYASTDDVTDGLGRTTRYTKQFGSVSYEAVRRHGSSGDNVRINIDNTLHVSSIVRDGATWTYAFASPTASTSSLTVTDPVGRARKYQSDLTVGLPTRVEDEYGRVTSYTYDGSGRLKTGTSPGGQVTTYDYDDRGNVIKTTVTAVSGATLSSSATYQDYSCPTVGFCNRMASSTSERGVVTTYGYDSTHGGVTSAVTQNTGGINPSVQTRYTQVAGVWMPTSSWTCATLASCENAADAVRTVTQYNANLLPASVTSGAGDGSVQAVTALTYTAAGDLLTVDGPLPDAVDTTRYYYDAGRQRLGAIGPDPDGSGPLLRRAVQAGYDGWGRATSVAQGTATDQGDAALVGIAVLQAQTITLDDAGRTRSAALSSGGTTFSRTDYAYDAAGRPTCTTQRMNPNTLGAAADACSVGGDTGYGPDRATLVQYSAAGAGQSASTSVTSAYGTAQAATETILQTLTGKPSSVTDGNGNVTSYAYDGFDRPWRTCYQTASSAACGGAPNDYEQLGYDAKGSVTSQRKRDGRTLTFGYDALNRMTSKTVPNARSVYYAYDLTGAMSEAHFDSLGGADYVKNAYNALGQVTTSTTSMAGLTRALSYTYDATGNRAQITHPDGTAFRYDYDNLGRLNHLKDGADNQLGLYVYLDNGKLTWRGQGANGTGYGYDAMGRILSYNMQRLNGGSVTAVNTALAYNAASQIVQQTRNSDAYAYIDTRNVDRSYVPNGLNQYSSVGPDTYSYDANGNLTSDGGNTYTYDAENRLTGVTGARSGSLVYDPIGRLWQTNGSGGVTQFLYDGAQLVAEYNSAGGLLRRYVQGTGNDDPLLWYEGASTSPYRLYTDHLGSVVGIIQDDGTMRQINTYDEYGVPGSGNLGRFQYTGQAYIPELGLYYYKARMYSPMLGRFMQTDPIGYGDGINWYNYVGGDPINMTDPSGLRECPAGQIWVSGPQYPNNDKGVCLPIEFTVMGPSSRPPSLPAPQLPIPLLQPYTSGWPAGRQLATSQVQTQCPAVPNGGPGSGQLNRNIQEASRQRSMNAGESWSIFSVPALEGGTGAWFAGQVKTGGAWDYKNKGYSGGRNFGNFNYGATAAALGYDWTTTMGAAHAYSLIDTGGLEGESAQIRAGFEYARRGCK